jgi:hypothetical protein
MPCNAQNHPASCNCGWGAKWHGNVNKRYGVVAAPGPVKVYHPAQQLSQASAGSIFGSITIPNAKCPVCSVSVFFYRNKFGSKVFFDDLGPPWPKHPCTDNPRWRSDKVHQILAPAKPPKPRAAFLDSDWLPNLLVCVLPHDLFDDRVFVVEDRMTGSLLKMFADAEITTPMLASMYVRQQERGYFEVSYIDLDSGQPCNFIASGMKVDADAVLTEFEIFRYRVRSYERKVRAEQEIDSIRRNRVRPSVPG